MTTSGDECAGFSRSRTTEFSVPSGGGGIHHSGAASPDSIRDDATATSSDLPNVEFNISSIQIDDTVGVEVDSDLSDEHLDDEENDDTKSDNTDDSGV